MMQKINNCLVKNRRARALASISHTAEPMFTDSLLEEGGFELAVPGGV
jgi:hypothetical protein